MTEEKRKELEEELKEVEQQRFILLMKDHWEHGDYYLNRKLWERIEALKEELK